MRDILNSYSASDLKKEISKYNKKVKISGYSKMTKSQLVNEMMKHQDTFNYLKKKEKAGKPAPKPAPKTKLIPHIQKEFDEIRKKGERTEAMLKELDNLGKKYKKYGEIKGRDIARNRRDIEGAYFIFDKKFIDNENNILKVLDELFKKDKVFKSLAINNLRLDIERRLRMCHRSIKNLEKGIEYIKEGKVGESIRKDLFIDEKRVGPYFKNLIQLKNHCFTQNFVNKMNKKPELINDLLNSKNGLKTLNEEKKTYDEFIKLLKSSKYKKYIN